MDTEEDRGRVETSSADVSLGSDGVVRVRMKPGSEITADDMEEIMEAVERLSEGKAPLLMDITGQRSISREARRMIHDRPEALHSAAAILVGSHLTRLMGSFFLKVERPSFPVKLFEDEESALEWLHGREVEGEEVEWSQDLDEVMDVIIRLASGDYGARAFPEDEDSEAGALKTAVNMLGEELEAKERARSEAERELKREKKRLRTLFEASPDAIGIHDIEGNYLDVNRQFIEDTGFSREQLLSMGVDEVEANYSLEELKEMWREIDLGQRIKAEGIHRRKDGSLYPTEVWVKKTEVGGEEFFIALSRDITERKEREEARREAEQRLKEAQRMASLGHWDWDVETNDLEWSDEIFRIFGVEPGSVEMTYPRFLEFVHPEDRDRVEEAVEEGLEKNNYEIDHRIVRPDGEVRIVHEKADVHYTEGGEPVRMLGTVQDVTENRRLERELRRKNEELTLLNRITRHDIRNDMNVITGWAEELEGHVDEEGRGYLKTLRDTSKHVIDLTKTARDFLEASEEDTEEKTGSIKVRDVIEQTVDSRRATYGEADFQVSGDLPDVEVEATELLSTVFRNLLNNAVQHNDKEKPRVRISAEEQDGKVVISVADNGPGVPDSQKKAIFGKGEKGLESQGTGIGLYLVNTLIHSYGGEVWVEDNDPRGAVFRVELNKS